MLQLSLSDKQSFQAERGCEPGRRGSHVRVVVVMVGLHAESAYTC